MCNLHAGLVNRHSGGQIVKLERDVFSKLLPRFDADHDFRRLACLRLVDIRGRLEGTLNV